MGANINQLARWANTCKRATEAVEVLTALAGIERRIAEFASCASAENEPEAEPC
ncbi:plasmid mobilization relaxosome protein MobC [Desulfovibrio sp. ZJ369]|uniref:plasmid mobilization relaxosome protein MobC n=1 Tax=Desulfovibrio sp. ZJ369 TaxID=2709793 RepID=UPI002405F3B4|nr:plasmid mobilization relaxosome protein MobC [Desulfovibrio sp. ZJ369]